MNNKTWTNIENDILRRMYCNVPLWAIAALLGRSFYAVKKQIKVLGLKNKKVYLTRTHQTGDDTYEE